MKPIVRLGATAVLLVLLAGCGTDAESPSGPAAQTPQVIDLDDPLGGFTLSDEEVAFGDVELAASVDTEAEIEDPIADTPEFGDIERDRTIKVYPMTVAWGILTDPTLGQVDDGLPAVPVTDWSGSIQVSRGAIALQRTISFDVGDAVLLPRPDMRRIDWISRTTRHFDGLRLLVLLPQNNEPGSGPDSLWFSTEAYSQGFALPDDLVKLDEIVDVEDQGNQVRFHAYETPGVLFQVGFLAGRWGLEPGEKVGQFAGRWVDREGVVGGFLRGVYGYDSANRPVLFGKIIGRHGDFVGILKGTWTQDPVHGSGQTRSGRFQGAILRPNAENEIVAVGQAEGRWRSVPNQPGYFDGRYCFGCN